MKRQSQMMLLMEKSQANGCRKAKGVQPFRFRFFLYWERPANMAEQKYAKNKNERVIDSCCRPPWQTAL
jgi:hypothetical protein